MTQPENIDGVRLKVTRKVFTLANIFSFSRVFVAFPIIWVYEYHEGPTWIFAALIGYGILSDYLDGWAARRQNEISELGKVIDPIADKVMAGILFIYAATQGLIPIWFVSATLIRDLIIMAGSLYIRKKHEKVAMSVMSGKIFVNFLAGYWIIVMFFPESSGWIQFGLLSSTILMIYSFAEYVVRFIRILKGAQFN
jgi:CDP-diacylglycerol--glycerol-3-phosphate 3-phosphatidyltransferase